MNTHPTNCSGCPYCNDELRLIMDDFVSGRHKSQSQRLMRLTRAELPHRFNNATTAPSPTLDQFVKHLRIGPRAVEPLPVPRSVTQSAATDIPSGYAPSPGITIAPKEK